MLFFVQHSKSIYTFGWTATGRQRTDASRQTTFQLSNFTKHLCLRMNSSTFSTFASFLIAGFLCFSMCLSKWYFRKNVAPHSQTNGLSRCMTLMWKFNCFRDLKRRGQALQQKAYDESYSFRIFRTREFSCVWYKIVGFVGSIARWFSFW